jgi:hypothetical protein
MGESVKRLALQIAIALGSDQERQAAPATMADAKNVQSDIMVHNARRSAIPDALGMSVGKMMVSVPRVACQGVGAKRAIRNAPSLLLQNRVVIALMDFRRRVMKNTIPSAARVKHPNAKCVPWAAKMANVTTKVVARRVVLQASMGKDAPKIALMAAPKHRDATGIRVNALSASQASLD